MRKSFQGELDETTLERLESLMDDILSGKKVDLPKMVPAARVSAVCGDKAVCFNIVTTNDEPIASIGVVRSGRSRWGLWNELTDHLSVPLLWNSPPSSQTWFVIRMEPGAATYPHVESIIWSLAEHLSWAWWMAWDKRRRVTTSEASSNT